MATVGTRITSAEAGTKRIDDKDSRFVYSSGVTHRSSLATAYNSTDSYYPSGEYVSFKFKSSLLRIYGVSYDNTGNSVTLEIDGTKYEMNPSVYCGSTATWQVLHFDIHGLDDSIHTAKLINTSTNNGNYYFDCIDIDLYGYLILDNDLLPYTKLNEVYSINDMKIGDCIRCRYTAYASGYAGCFSELGTTAISLLDTDSSKLEIPDGSFYFIKVSKGLLIADRVIHTKIACYRLNNVGYIQGIDWYEYKIPYITSLSNTFCTITSSASSPTPIFQRGCTSSTWYTGTTSPVKITIGDITVSNTQWVKVDMNNGNIITGATHFVLRGQVISVGKYAVKAFDLYISEDGVTYKKILSQDNNPNDGEHHYFEIDSSLKIVSFLFSIRSGWYNQTPAYTGAAEMNFIEIDNTKLIRSLTGGCAYRSENGTKTLTQVNKFAWPINNEWDMYVYGSSLNGTIKMGDDEIWHTSTGQSWCKETPVTGTWKDLYNNAYNSNTSSNIARGSRNDTNIWPHMNFGYSDNDKQVGFRPVLEYNE